MKNLVFNPELAKKIGLNEAIILHQIKYWCDINKSKKVNYVDGYYWTFNTFEQWQEQFPFWSLSTIKRTISKLEKDGYIISSNYNKKGFDRTKWYRINDDIISIRDNALVQNDTMDSFKFNQPIQENNKENNIRQEEKRKMMPLDNKDLHKFILDYMNDLYFNKTGNKHPKLKSDQYTNVYNSLSNCLSELSIDIDILYEMARKFFDTNIETDYNINHFATEGILLYRYLELGYY